jgi:hypothetical protein
VNPRDYQQHMVDLVSEHPELLEILKERRALAEHYQRVRKQKLEGTTFVWD